MCNQQAASIAHFSTEQEQRIVVPLLVFVSFCILAFCSVLVWNFPLGFPTLSVFQLSNFAASTTFLCILSYA
jgi:hypothetical protein